MTLPSSASSSRLITLRPFVWLITWSFPKALKRILYRQFLCLERPSDCSPELLALRMGPVPTLGPPIDLTKEHSDVRRYRTHDSSIRTRHLTSRVYTDAIDLRGAARTSLIPTARIVDALSVTRTTLLIESTLNVGSNSGLSTVGLGTDEERGHRRRSMSPAIRSGAQRPLLREAAAIP
jgi:hypothetical protein